MKKFLLKTNFISNSGLREHSRIFSGVNYDKASLLISEAIRMTLIWPAHMMSWLLEIIDVTDAFPPN